MAKTLAIQGVRMECCVLAHNLNVIQPVFYKEAQMEHSFIFHGNIHHSK